jgi:hypothetical protein
LMPISRGSTFGSTIQSRRPRPRPRRDRWPVRRAHGARGRVRLQFHSRHLLSWKVCVIGGICAEGRSQLIQVEDHRAVIDESAGMASKKSIFPTGKGGIFLHCAGRKSITLSNNKSSGSIVKCRRAEVAHGDGVPEAVGLGRIQFVRQGDGERCGQRGLPVRSAFGAAWRASRAWIAISTWPAGDWRETVSGSGSTWVRTGTSFLRGLHCREPPAIMHWFHGGRICPIPSQVISATSTTA